MDIEKAKKVFEKYINGKDTMKETLIKAIEVLLNELDKKDKIINEMVEQLEVTYNNGIYTGQKATEEVIKDAIKQLEEDIQYSANPLSIDNSKFAIKILKNILGDEENI